MYLLRDEMEKDNSSVRKLSALTITGLIMVFVPLNTTLILLLYTVFRKIDPPVEGLSFTAVHNNTAVQNLFIAGLAVFICGLVVLGYIAARRFRQQRKS